MLGWRRVVLKMRPGSGNSEMLCFRLTAQDSLMLMGLQIGRAPLDNHLGSPHICNAEQCHNLRYRYKPFDCCNLHDSHNPNLHRTNAREHIKRYAGRGANYAICQGQKSCKNYAILCEIMRKSCWQIRTWKISRCDDEGKIRVLTHSKHGNGKRYFEIEIST